MESGLGGRPHPIAGRYALVDRIGTGSTGSVWRAYDQRTQSWLALKLLTARSGSLLLRFVREEGLRIPHRHVVAPTDWAAEDDLVVLIMDLVSGGSTADLLAEHGALPEDRPASAVAALVELRTLALPAWDGSIAIPDRLPPNPAPL